MPDRNDASFSKKCHSRAQQYFEVNRRYPIWYLDLIKRGELSREEVVKDDESNPHEDEEVEENDENMMKRMRIQIWTCRRGATLDASESDSRRKLKKILILILEGMRLLNTIYGSPDEHGR
jgi:hypothetical protein